MRDIVEELRAKELPGELKYISEAREVLRDLLDYAAAEIVSYREKNENFKKQIYKMMLDASAAQGTSIIYAMAVDEVIKVLTKAQEDAKVVVQDHLNFTEKHFDD